MSLMARTSYFAVCIKNEGYPASLELRKIYEVLPDANAERESHVRVVDESGEDFLYPKEFFLPIELSEAQQRALLRAS
jgi:hypothetical protein